MLTCFTQVSEHQPTAWPSFFFDLNLLIYLFPAGVFLCFHELREEHVFVIIYSVMASYFAGVMVRLMLTLTPIVCVTASMVISKLYATYLDPVEPDGETKTSSAVDTDGPASASPSKSSKKKKGTTPNAPPPLTAAPKSGKALPGIWGIDTRFAVVGLFTLLLATFCIHCTYVTSIAYSSPSVVLASRGPDGQQNIIDDFREAYYWLRENTKEDAKVMSWWDYGYQIAGFADRTTLVDNSGSIIVCMVCDVFADGNDFSIRHVEQHTVCL
jgi:dolichyl-diphosphooligosaccharide--protein glycosyltransferase